MTTLPFNQSHVAEANRLWGCNCGPAALAAVLGITLEQARVAVEKTGFADRGYMNPTMMADAIGHAGGKIVERMELPLDRRIACDTDYFSDGGLARIQWTGPWTAKGANHKWAYRATHWIATCRLNNVQWMVYDVNGGSMLFDHWLEHVVPEITATIKRADGGWFITHSWKVER